MTKFKIGDMVKVVNYGHQIVVNSEMLTQNPSSVTENPPPSVTGMQFSLVDIHNSIVGKTGIVVEAEVNQERSQYAVKGPSKHAWYDDGQLELIYRPEYPAEETLNNL